MPQRKETFITDIPSRVVGGFKPAKGVGRGWVSVDYETATVSGTGIATGYDSGAPELKIRLGLEGSYVLYLGLGMYDGVRVWLDGDDGFRELLCGHGGRNLQECRLHRVDLTPNRKLHIAPIPVSAGREPDSHTFLAYIRAVPSDHAPRKSARNLVATNDGFSWIAIDGMESIRDVTKQFEAYRDSDFFRVIWCPAGADVSGNHLSRVGTTMPFDTTHTYRRCDHHFAKVSGRILKAGSRGDILRAAVRAARDVGVEFHFYIRPEAFFAPFPYDIIFDSKFLVKNPRLRCRDEFGREVMRMSYAYPAVQEHMLAYVDELLGYDPDGICLAFNRSLPMMICEQPVLDAFERKHRRAPRLPAEVDSEEMLAVRHELLTGFIERLVAKLRKRRKVFSCIAPHDNAGSRLMGLDLEALIDRGLVESVYSTGPCPRSDFWKKLRDQDKTRVYSSIHYGHEGNTAAANPYDHKTQARALHEVIDGNFAGTFWWDAESMFANPYNWHVLRHGGSPEFLDRVIADDPQVAPAFRALETIRGVRLDRYNPMSSY